MLYQIQTKYRDEARPRAGILRGREFLMKDSYSFDLDRRGPRRVLPAAPRRPTRIFDRLGLDSTYRRGDVRRDGRLGVRGVPRASPNRRGHVRAQPRRLRGQRRGGHTTPAARRVRSRACPARGAPHAEHARRSRRWSTFSTRDNGVGHDLGRTFTAADTLKNVAAQDARAGRERSGRCWCRRARRPRGRHEAPGGRAGPGRGRAARRGRLRWATRSSSRATSARSRWLANGVRYLVDPAHRHRHGLGHRRGQARPPRRRPRRAAATSPPTGRSRPPRCAPATPAPDGCRPAGGRARHRDRARLPARPQVHRRARARRARPGRQAVRDHHGLLRRRRSPGRSRRSPSSSADDRRAGLAGGWSRRSTCTW